MSSHYQLQYIVIVTDFINSWKQHDQVQFYKHVKTNTHCFDITIIKRQRQRQ